MRLIDADALKEEITFHFDLELEPVIEKEALRMIDEQETISAASPKWISVKDRLPEDYVLVLAFGDEGILIAEHYRFGDWVKFMLDKDGRYMSPYPTTIYYWMPLPEPPEVEDANDE